MGLRAQLGMTTGFPDPTVQSSFKSAMYGREGKGGGERTSEESESGDEDEELRSSIESSREEVIVLERKRSQYGVLWVWRSTSRRTHLPEPRRPVSAEVELREEGDEHCR